ncbi:MAG TPA: type II toxin-antitoxin system Phd/YefM family antitoxin [Candidatus Lustribacter sp.]|jgi:antitoxin YefM|nr:type II toxin-antitoxin system Phd/YefM family antitoxin [Candidatus Lustribacter sp.]
MQTLPISKAKDRLNELVDEAAATHEHFTITRNGTPAAMLIGMQEWESIQETLFWLSQEGVRQDIERARQEHAAGQTLSEEQVRAQLGIPRRP